MYTEITFNPITKYLVIFLLSYMFLNHIKMGQQQIVHTLCFIMILIITVDIYEFGEYGHLLKLTNEELVDGSDV